MSWECSVYTASRFVSHDLFLHPWFCTPVLLYRLSCFQNKIRITCSKSRACYGSDCIFISIYSIYVTLLFKVNRRTVYLCFSVTLFVPLLKTPDVVSAFSTVFQIGCVCTITSDKQPSPESWGRTGASLHPQGSHLDSSVSIVEISAPMISPFIYFPL